MVVQSSKRSDFANDNALSPPWAWQLTSAPLASSISQSGRRPRRAARCKAAWPSGARALTSGWQSSAAAASGKLPRAMQRMSTVSPSPSTL